MSPRPPQPNNAGIEQPKSFWGDNPRLRNFIIVLLFGVILARIVTTVWLVEDHWREAAEWVGFPVPPKPDRSRANAMVRASDLQTLLGDPNNYPDEARVRGEQGRVEARLSVAPSGVVKDCIVQKSSRSPSLDEATCRLAKGLRLDPARGSEGEAIASVFVLRIRWVLPSE